MKGFKINESGDVVITNNQIELVEGVELVAQTVKQVLNTHIGEWFGDKDEGIDRYTILNKNPNHELIQDMINTAVQSVADTKGVELETDDFTFDVIGRDMTIVFTLSMNKESTSVKVTL